ncbi:MAG: hypothetical protein M3Q58_02390 [Bacteroidota bacterium]|nr:hypothetical protein [Bacteroidota bacterium]
MENLRNFFSLTFFSLFLVLSSFADNASGEANQTMKNVFKEVKKDVSGSTNISSVLMIIGVVAVVGIAIYLSFNGSDEKKVFKKVKK